jgi:hypothetical protein
MPSEEELLRNIHPIDFDNGRINSSAFNPSAAHDFMLSVDQSSLSAPAESYDRHIANNLESIGVFSVLKNDFSEESIPTKRDPIDENPAHALADFNSHGVTQRKKKARRLAVKAVKYGIKYQP